MNRKIDEQQNNLAEQENGVYIVRRNRGSNIVAAAVCLLIAFIVWLFAMSAEDTAILKLEAVGGNAEYTYVLSDSALEISGSIMSIKKADHIEVIVPAVAATEPGTYAISLEDLVLPEGVALTDLPQLTLTVERK